MRTRRTPVVPLLALVALAAAGCGAAHAAAAPDSGSGPSNAAKMICSSETRDAIAAGAELRHEPAKRSSWSNGLYRCDYTLPGGHLVLQVDQLADDAAATAHFEDLRNGLGHGTPVSGAANLGRAGFQADSGVVVFVKDDLTLEVDARGLPAGIGPDAMTRGDFAYEVASDVLACWKGP